jgi:hypothetical protein
MVGAVVMVRRASFEVAGEPTPLLTTTWNLSPESARAVGETVKVAVVVPVYLPPSIRGTKPTVPNA